MGEMIDLDTIQDYFQLCAEEFLAGKYRGNPNWKINGEWFDPVTDEYGNYSVPIQFKRLSDDTLIEVDVWVSVRVPRKRRTVTTIKTNGLT